MLEATWPCISDYWSRSNTSIFKQEEWKVQIGPSYYRKSPINQYDLVAANYQGPQPIRYEARRLQYNKCGFDCTREKDSITRLADFWFGCTCSLLVSHLILYLTRKYIRRYVGSRISVSFGAIWRPVRYWIKIHHAYFPFFRPSLLSSHYRKTRWRAQ